MTEHDDHRATNAISAGGQAADPGNGSPESGMPAGGPDDLAVRSAEAAATRANDHADPFGAGIDARANGASAADCPYPDNSDDAARWVEGFHYRDSASAGV